ncbi:hypothetical protein GCM10027614_12470 [Micromonospora vulcania]
MASATSAAAAAVGTASTLPAGSGRPARLIRARADDLSASAAITAGGGPMKTSPLSAQISAKSASSERKP